MLARAVMGRILLAMPRLCHPPLPTACEHISKQRNTATRRADIAPGACHVGAGVPGPFSAPNR